VRTLDRDDLQQLFAVLHDRGLTVVGPTVRDHAIVLDELASADELPVGWNDAQGPGRYRLSREGDRVFEGYVVGPDSLKQTLFPAREVLYEAERRPDGTVGFAPVVADPPGRAFVGVRACDLAAADVQDRTFLRGPHVDPRYRARRARTFLVAVNCTEPGDLCFCASTKTGPRVTEGADLVLTERADDFLVEAGTEAGREVLEALETGEATDEDAAWLDAAMAEAEGKMGRAMETEGLPALLFGRLDHPRWDDVADRCLACGNCTSVCPTCFCSTAEEDSDLVGHEGAHQRLWDSCFTEGHAAIHGGSFRPTVKDRYRQWLTHKVGAWVSQYGTSGCVGCGRCIAWCPVGIDLTEEVAALREGEGEAPLPAPPTFAEHRDEDVTPRPAEVVAVTRETADVVTLHVRADGFAPFAPGQFCMLSLPAVGEAPISISGSDGAALELTIREAGAVTRALCALEPGQQLGVRGPYGQPWPLETMAGGPVAVVAGGIGLAPLRDALRRMLGRPRDFPEVHLFYGARSPDDAIFVREMLGWLEEPTFHLHVTVDQATPSWRGHVGVVTRLLAPDLVPEGTHAIVCGPEVMMGFTIEALSKLGVPDERVYVTMERHMKCATGFCGRCQYGPWFVCKDGPVFRYDRIRMLFGREGY
jgi:NAD(P)H-flavin reductase/ferredoxin